MSDLEEKRQELTECQEEVERLEKSELRKLSTAARREWKGKYLKVQPVDDDEQLVETAYSLVFVTDIEAVAFNAEDDPMYMAAVNIVEFQSRVEEDDPDDEPEWTLEFRKDQRIPTHAFLTNSWKLSDVYIGAQIITKEKFEFEVKSKLDEVASIFTTAVDTRFS